MTIADLGYEVRDSWKPDDNNDEILPYLGLGSVPEDDLHIEEVDSSEGVKSSKYKFKKGDILFGTLRPYFRKLVIAAFDGICSTEFSVIRPHEDCDREYLFYALAQNKFIDYATVNSKGDRPRTKWKLYSDFELNDTNKVQRVKIGEVLSKYDELIEVNRNQIKLLKKSASLLYKKWFSYLEFPGYEEVSVKNQIPDGWSRKKLGDVITLHYGKALKADDRIKGDYPVFGSGGRIGSHNEPLEEGPGIIIGRKGNVGSIYWSEKDYHPIDTVYYVDKESTNYYLYHLLKNLPFDNNDGAVPGLNRDFAYSRKFVQPGNELIEKFNKEVNPIYQQTYLLGQMNKKLKKARDLLLPRLMNGGIPV